MSLLDRSALRYSTQGARRSSPQEQTISQSLLWMWWVLKLHTFSLPSNVKESTGIIMFQEFVEVLMGSAQAGGCTDVVKTVVSEVRPGITSASFDDDNSSGSSSAGEEDADSIVAGSSTLTHTEINADHLSPKHHTLSELSNSESHDSSKEEELEGTFDEDEQPDQVQGDSLEGIPSEKKVTFSDDNSKQLPGVANSWPGVCEPQEGKQESSVSSWPVATVAQKKTKKDKKTEDCLRQLHLRDQYLKEKLAKKLRAHQEREKRLGKEQMQMIFSRHIRPGALAFSNDERFQPVLTTKDTLREPHDPPTSTSSAPKRKDQQKDNNDNSTKTLFEKLHKILKNSGGKKNMRRGNLKQKAWNNTLSRKLVQGH